jgi:hypothetical protein
MNQYNMMKVSLFAEVVRSHFFNLGGELRFEGIHDRSVFRITGKVCVLLWIFLHVERLHAAGCVCFVLNVGAPLLTP